MFGHDYLEMRTNYMVLGKVKNVLNFLQMQKEKTYNFLIFKRVQVLIYEQ